MLQPTSCDQVSQSVTQSVRSRIRSVLTVWEASMSGNSATYLLTGLHQKRGQSQLNDSSPPRTCEHLAFDATNQFASGLCELDAKTFHPNLSLSLHPLFFWVHSKQEAAPSQDRMELT